MHYTDGSPPDIRLHSVNQEELELLVWLSWYQVFLRLHIRPLRSFNGYLPSSLPKKATPPPRRTNTLLVTAASCSMQSIIYLYLFSLSSSTSVAAPMYKDSHLHLKSLASLFLSFSLFVSPACCFCRLSFDFSYSSFDKRQQSTQHHDVLLNCLYQLLKFYQAHFTNMSVVAVFQIKPLLLQRSQYTS